MPGTSQRTCPGEHKVLGVRWNVGVDQFISNEIAMPVGPTESRVVSIMGKFYDWLGYLAPMTIHLRCFPKVFPIYRITGNIGGN